MGRTAHALLAASADDTFRQQVVEVLRTRTDVDVRTTDKGHETIMAVLEEGIAAVILDLDLSSLEDSLATLDVLKKLHPRMPIIVVSADTSTTTGTRVVEKGVFYYLFKPVNVMELGEVVENAIKQLDGDRKRFQH
jgi:DNA-binding NtrC family response regulator